jgi:hypothetical protein
VAGILMGKNKNQLRDINLKIDFKNSENTKPKNYMMDKNSEKQSGNSLESTQEKNR